jgi:Na+/H+ antiporter NhaA
MVSPSDCEARPRVFAAENAMPASTIRRFLQLEAAGGIVLMAAAVVALLCANIPGLAGAYPSLLDLPIEITLGSLELHKNVLLTINDGLMAVFFLLIALEIKREMRAGELSSLKQIALPGVAAGRSRRSRTSPFRSPFSRCLGVARRWR